MLWGREQWKVKHKKSRQLVIGTMNEKIRSVRVGVSDVGVRGAGEWYSAKHIWEHPLVLEGIHGAGDVVLLGGMTSKGEEFFRKPPYPLFFLLQVAGMDSIDRARMGRWIELVGPLTEEDRGEKTCAAKVSARGSGAVGRMTVTWSTWSTGLSQCTFCHRRLMSPWRGGCAHAHPPVMEISVCAAHGLRFKGRMALRSSLHTPHSSPVLPRWEDVPSLGDWHNVRVRNWRDWRTEMNRWLWIPVRGWLGSKCDWQLEGHAGTVDWGEGLENRHWMGRGCPMAGHPGQGEAQEAPTAANKVGGLPCAPVGERESRCTLYQDERRDEVIRKTRVPKLSKM